VGYGGEGLVIGFMVRRVLGVLLVKLRHSVVKLLWKMKRV
jgi:hypothetical protein